MPSPLVPSFYNTLITPRARRRIISFTIRRYFIPEEEKPCWENVGYRGISHVGHMHVFIAHACIYSSCIYLCNMNVDQKPKQDPGISLMIDSPMFANDSTSSTCRHCIAPHYYLISLSTTGKQILFLMFCSFSMLGWILSSYLCLSTTQRSCLTPCPRVFRTCCGAQNTGWSEWYRFSAYTWN